MAGPVPICHTCLQVLRRWINCYSFWSCTVVLQRYLVGHLSQVERCIQFVPSSNALPPIFSFVPSFVPSRPDITLMFGLLKVWETTLSLGPLQSVPCLNHKWQECQFPRSWKIDMNRLSWLRQTKACFACFSSQLAVLPLKSLIFREAAASSMMEWPAPTWIVDITSRLAYVPCSKEQSTCH